MPAIVLKQFDGIYPRQSAYELPQNAAQVAQNVKLYAGELRAWQKPLALDPQPVLVTNPLALHRLERPTDLASVWLSWQADVDVVVSPIADTTDGRIYYTGEATPRKTNYARAISGAAPYPFDYYELGVPAPTLAFSASSSGGTGGAQTRVYLETFISTFGSVLEESAPSPPVTVASQVTGATVSISALNTAPGGKYNITHRRIYRAVGGNDSLDYRLVVELPIATVVFSDTLNDADLPGDPLISLEFTPPPSDLKGLVAMAGGFLAGFRKNEVWFSEPNFPHAWPVGYVLAVKHQIVGLGVVGGLLVVATVQSPEIIYGQEPGALQQEPVPLIEPCASKRSITTDGEAVIYASPNGLVAIGPGIRKRFTDNLFRRDEFQIYNPATLYAKVYDGTYFGWFNADDFGAVLINSTDRPALSTMSAARYTTAAFIDTRTAALYFVDPADGDLYEFDADPVNNDTYTWRSKKFRAPFPVSTAVLQTYADYSFVGDESETPADVIAFNTALIAAGGVRGAVNANFVNEFPVNGSLIETPGAGVDARFVQVNVYGDGELISSQGFTTEAHRKQPSGKRYSTYEIEVIGNAPVYSVALATAVRDLKGE